MARAMATVETKPAKEDRTIYFGDSMDEVKRVAYQFVQKYGVRILVTLIFSVVTYVSATIDLPDLTEAPDVKQPADWPPPCARTACPSGAPGHGKGHH